MKHFFTKSTVEASIYCKKCGKDIMWAVNRGRPSYCTACYNKGAPPKEKAPEPAQSGDLFA
jgi:formylmethanofuran dehydrogenase subunit E